MWFPDGVKCVRQVSIAGVYVFKGNWSSSHRQLDLKMKGNRTTPSKADKRTCKTFFKQLLQEIKFNFIASQNSLLFVPSFNGCVFFPSNQSKGDTGLCQHRVGRVKGQTLLKRYQHTPKSKCFDMLRCFLILRPTCKNQAYWICSSTLCVLGSCLL